MTTINLMKTISTLGITALLITAIACQKTGDNSQETDTQVNSRPTGYEILAEYAPNAPSKTIYKVNYDPQGRVLSNSFSFNEPLSYALEMYQNEGVDWEKISVEGYVAMTKQTDNYDYNEDNHSATLSSKTEVFSFSPTDNKWSWQDSNESSTIAFDDEWRVKSPYSGSELSYKDGYLSTFGATTFVWDGGDLKEMTITAPSGLTRSIAVTYSSETSPFLNSVEPLLPDIPECYIFGQAGKHCKHLPSKFDTTVRYAEGTTQISTCEIEYKRDSYNRIIEVHYIYPNKETGEREETNYFHRITY